MGLDYYEVLQVSRNASHDIIQTAYRRLAQVHHPDHGGDEQMMKLINEAYSVLNHPESRKEYDQLLKTGDQSKSKGEEASEERIKKHLNYIRDMVLYGAKLIELNKSYKMGEDYARWKSEMEKAFSDIMNASSAQGDKYHKMMAYIWEKARELYFEEKTELKLGKQLVIVKKGETTFRNIPSLTEPGRSEFTHPTPKKDILTRLWSGLSDIFQSIFSKIAGVVMLVALIAIVNGLYLGGQELYHHKDNANLNTIQNELTAQKSNLERMQQQIDSLASSITNEQNQMESWKAAGMTDLYNSNLSSYNSIIDEYNKQVAIFEEQRKSYNNKVEEYNKLSKETGDRWYIVPIPRR